MAELNTVKVSYNRKYGVKQITTAGVMPASSSTFAHWSVGWERPLLPLWRPDRSQRRNAAGFRCASFLLSASSV